ncbi:MAG TPA: SDR family NAD(P)-dependent oxidoreductase [Stellaceae bacterium]|nr:SDR family NAD(P)-dependent oxidoreductase [Stellaceae bacterium]
MTKGTAIVTGANGGIGLYTALGLARAGMRVVMVGRDAGRLDAGRRFVAERTDGTRLAIAAADFASLAAVRRLAAELLASEARIDVLVNNAGLSIAQFARTADGNETTFAVNHLAPFLLTNLLLDRLKASTPARVITVASAAHRRARLDLATVNGPRDWSMVKAYSRSKLCNILFTAELARRLDGSGVVATCLHPGVVATAIAAHGLVGLFWRLGRPFMVSPEKGAETSVFLATVADPAPFHGAYVVGRERAETDPQARDPALARALWEESARLTGLASQ